VVTTEPLIHLESFAAQVMTAPFATAGC
jgi:hypothetical protein